jgi:hypothetical protein
MFIIGYVNITKLNKTLFLILFLFINIRIYLSRFAPKCVNRHPRSFPVISIFYQSYGYKFIFAVGTFNRLMRMAIDLPGGVRAEKCYLFI